MAHTTTGTFVNKLRTALINRSDDDEDRLAVADLADYVSRHFHGSEISPIIDEGRTRNEQVRLLLDWARLHDRAVLAQLAETALGALEAHKRGRR